MRLVSQSRLALAAIAALSGASCGSDGEVDAGGGGAGAGTAGVPAGELRVLTGALPLYHLQGKPRNDASAVVFLRGLGKLLVIDDGGDDQKPEAVPFYRTDVAALFATAAGDRAATAEVPGTPEALATSLPARHRDMEGATADGGLVYVTSSLPDAAEAGKAPPEFRAFSRFHLEGDAITDERTIEPRSAIVEALSRPTGDPWFADWLTRWTVEHPNSRECGVNVEALSRTPRAGKLLFGLRSPHYGADFCQPDEMGKLKTRTGAALLVEVDVGAFEADKLAPAVHAKLDLGGLGLRGLEYSPTAQGYFLTAGAVEAGFDYDFFFWKGDPTAAPVRLSDKIPEFAKLCRPESVEEIEHDGRRYLLVLSEESGAICEMPPEPYNYLLIELNRGFTDKLR